MSVSRFARLFADEREVIPLDEAALAIAAVLRGPIDEMEALVALDLIAGECPTPTAEGIARHLVDGLGFRGNNTAYYDWRNSCLDLVLAQRVGIPITLAVVMIEVGRRLGVELTGVGMPGHFLVGVPSGDVYFDIFHDADPLDRDGVRQRFDTLTDGGVPWDDVYLAPTPPRDLVIRMLNNLRGIFTARNDRLRLALVMRLRAEIPELADTEGADINAALAILN